MFGKIIIATYIGDNSNVFITGQQYKVQTVVEGNTIKVVSKDFNQVFGYTKIEYLLEDWSNLQLMGW